MTQPPEGMRLREAHAHIFQHGRSLGMVGLSECTSANDLLDAMAAARTPGVGVLGQGARPESWSTPHWPSLAEFDRATGDQPSVAWCFDYHALLANTAALRACGFVDGSPDPQGGVLGRVGGGKHSNQAGSQDSAGHAPLSGVVYERAALMVWEAIPEPVGTVRSQMVRAALEDLRSHGFVEVHDLKAQRWLPSELGCLDKLDMSAVLWPLMKDLAALHSTRDQWESNRLKLGGGKIFVDGTLNSRTAQMIHPFADGTPAHPRGMALMSTDEIAGAVEQADAFGLPIAAHAIGDGAVRAVLDALERVKPSSRGHRIEHAEVIDRDDVARIVRLRDELGLMISVQPCHLLTDIEALSRALPDRLDRVLPLRELIEAGLEPGRDLLFGSDVPIVRPHPQDSIRGAVNRKRADSVAIAPEQAISEDEAWACFQATSHA